MNEAEPSDSHRISLDLADPPTDPAEALGYAELFAMWTSLHNALETGRMSESEFETWDANVKAHLRRLEISRLEKPLRPHIPLDANTIQHARHFHLTKILWSRKGIEKYMKDTGY